MKENIYRKPRLAIISDTAMYMRSNVFIFEPVLREISYFSHLFTNIIWFGFGHQKPSPKNTKKEIPDNLELFTVKPCGGNTYVKKMGIIFFVPYYTHKIIQLIKKSDIIHTRGPSIPALLTILISFFYPKKKYWHKYAGNWQIDSKTLSYRIQRWLLMKKIPGKVIVSSRNKLDSQHILSWPNPCLTEKEISFNKQCGLNKKFDGKLIFCFVGRLEESKGFHVLLDAFSNLENIGWISKLHCVGKGSESEKYEKITQKNNISIIFHSILSRQELNQIYKESHFIILPSISEGFPKVLAEASSFGCIPIIPSIVSITNYINATECNGIILKGLSSNEIIKTIIRLDKDRHRLQTIAFNALNTARGFTYERYNQKIKKQFFCD